MVTPGRVNAFGQTKRCTILSRKGRRIFEHPKIKKKKKKNTSRDVELIGRKGNEIFFFFHRAFFGNPIPSAMANGLLLLLPWSIVNLPRPRPSREREKAARRREIVGSGGEKQGRGEREGKWKRVSGRRCVSRCGKFISTITGARRMAAYVR